MKRLWFLFGFLSAARAAFPLDITTDTVWSGNHQVTETVTVLDGVTLVIDAGTTVEFAADQLIVVRGRLLAEGTDSQPIFFTRLGHETGQGRAGKVRLASADGENRLVFCRFRYGDGRIDMAGGADVGVVSIHNSQALLQDCDFRQEQQGDCVYIINNCDVLLRRCYFGPGGEGIHGVNSDIEVDTCVFAYREGRYDASDIEGHRNIRVHDCVFLGSNLDDGCDFDNSNGIVERCWFFNYLGIATGWEGRCGGVTMNQSGAPTVRRNVFVNCRQGIISKGNCRPSITNCDFIDCTNGIAAYEAGEVPYLQVGFPTVRNCIFWRTTNTLVLGVDSGSGTSSTVDIDYCDVWSTPTVFAEDARTTVGGHIFTADPIFVDGEDGGDGFDLHLQYGSPCIRTGEHGVDVGAFPFASRARSWRHY